MNGLDRSSPVVRVVGNEFEVDGQLYVSGLVRNAKDAQRMYNYWCSQEAEMLALAPRHLLSGTVVSSGYEQQWKTANTQNWPYLEVNPDVTDGRCCASTASAGAASNGVQRSSASQGRCIGRHQVDDWSIQRIAGHDQQ